MRLTLRQLAALRRQQAADPAGADAAYQREITGLVFGLTVPHDDVDAGVAVGWTTHGGWRYCLVCAPVRPGSGYLTVFSTDHDADALCTRCGRPLNSHVA